MSKERNYESVNAFNQKAVSGFRINNFSPSPQRDSAAFNNTDGNFRNLLRS